MRAKRHRKNHEGFFRPRHPEKYAGDPTTIMFRSLLERSMMCYLDNSPTTLKWKSEIIVIPYVSPKDGKLHRYYPDLWVRVKDKTGSPKDYLIEIKPSEQTVPPKSLKEGVSMKKQRKYQEELMTYAINCAKWKEAKAWCSINNAEFIILTEEDIHGRKWH